MTDQSSILADECSGEELRLACPQCGRDDRIDIAALVWVRQTADGTDIDEADDHSHEWGDDSPAACRACGNTGPAKDFRPSPEAR